MPPRSYSMKKREKSTRETRQRIVEATFALHSEQPIAETTMRQIAERAGVGIGTVYNHFPTYDAAVTACGEHAFATACPPGADIFEGVQTRAARVERLVRELFAFYGRIPSLAAARADRAKIQALDQALSHWERQMHALVLLAVGEDVPAADLIMVEALLDYGVYARLAKDLRGDAAPADRMIELLRRWFAE